MYKKTELSISNMLLLACRAQFPLSNGRRLICLRENMTEEYIIELPLKFLFSFNYLVFYVPERKFVINLIFFSMSYRHEKFKISQINTEIRD